MRKANLLFALLMAASLMVPAAASAGFRGDRSELPDLVETAEAAGSFSILLTAVETAGLTDALKGDGPLTVLAPTDEAFVQLLTDLGITADELLENPDLAQILLYHVLPGDVPARKILWLDSATTAQGSDVKIDVSFQWRWPWWTIHVNDARVTQANIYASNGIIHVIDKVLMPPEDIVSIAEKAGSFTTLVAALKATGLDEVLGGTEGAPFTVFAPTDEAFAEIGLTVDTLPSNQDELDALVPILLYHVLGGQYLEQDLAWMWSAQTLNGVYVDINVRWRWFKPFRRIKINDSRVVATDILASNGVIHVIDKVLLPPSQ